MTAGAEGALMTEALTRGRNGGSVLSNRTVGAAPWLSGTQQLCGAQRRAAFQDLVSSRVPLGRGRRVVFEVAAG